MTATTRKRFADLTTDDVVVERGHVITSRFPEELEPYEELLPVLKVTVTPTGYVLVSLNAEYGSGISGSSDSLATVVAP